MNLAQLIQSIPATYRLSPKDTELFEGACAAVFVGDWNGLELGKQQLVESDDPNAIRALMAFNDHFLNRTPPEPVPYSAPTPESKQEAQKEAAALMGRLGVKS
ncbi:MAG: hypothetical protein A3C93_01680 [Candidatus Lloydbacteria bacterium RIFCSPHIGHO2_02_FULL_54_17]|uniref:Uncharacterized protein n=1 Tax=Candidatus Lloydbacteria bacterium RIFCSPHIGHO2_02_FULL_54_17 TaxID=1798664 RepID=A0A1G2DBZ7_9BACT|nr:MAG: hypothetical protein A2762_02860 [Candidatus Lloydbacteria bacterium RIFCSPHIGHO2_01_FULL_54_11]OGZ11063.1 MAG: hypothetical protein A3C93_01680 [Candidatus Lloydbacteria bacterium RIFCSPHIGHO2_02_FULL_54_17]OGZ14462.1 MAG: hypothetical protein A3H76_06195 [Candidatus Lloydbacteria bacterium RIFCSPLOWO2_02_FULL_54_12]OGZ15478.1 MAG: hypothetical protein A2948_02800 [Candidatus Lloydbacteria bacterium RIFCSPLOWO2_01_FULL_54_18]